MTAADYLSKGGGRRPSLTAPSIYAVALSMAAGIAGITWSMVTLGLPGFSGAQLFNWHPPLMILASFILLPLSARAISTMGRPVHIALNVLAVTAAVGGVVCAFLAHASQGYSNLYSAHSWTGLAAGGLALGAVTLAIGGWFDAHRRTGRLAVGTAFAAAALGFAEMQGQLILTDGHFAVSAISAGVLSLLALTIGLVVLGGSAFAFGRGVAMSVKTDLSVPLSDGDMSAEGDVVLFELEEAVVERDGVRGEQVQGDSARAATLQAGAPPPTRAGAVGARPGDAVVDVEATV